MRYMDDRMERSVAHIDDRMERSAAHMEGNMREIRQYILASRPVHHADASVDSTVQK